MIWSEQDDVQARAQGFELVGPRERRLIVPAMADAETDEDPRLMLLIHTRAQRGDRTASRALAIHYASVAAGHQDSMREAQKAGCRHRAAAMAEIAKQYDALSSHFRSFDQQG